MRWVLELSFAAFILILTIALYNYTAPASIAVQAGERGRVSELLAFAVRLAASPEFLFRLQYSWEEAVAQARREAALIDPLASVDVYLPTNGVCTTPPSPRIAISLATVLPNGTTVCIAVWA